MARTYLVETYGCQMNVHDSERIAGLLDEAGFAISTRSACETDPSRRGGAEAGSEEGSRAVYAVTGSREEAKSTLRISWGPHTREADLLRFADVLRREVAFVDNTFRR